MKYYKNLLLICLVFLISCTKNTNNTVPQTDPAIAQEILNAPYGNNSQQVMDIYLPQNRSEQKTKVLVLIHGGGWKGGDKSEMTSFITPFKEVFPDYAIFNINYRLYSNGNNKFPTQENDVNAAIAYIYKNKKSYHIADICVYIGVSAGAQLALLQAYKHSDIIKPKAVVSFFGPTDLAKLYNENTEMVLNFIDVFGGTLAEVPEMYHQSSPINFVTASSPPTFILQGGKDEIVLPAQATDLYNKLQAVNVPSTLKMYPNAGHGWGEPDITDSYTRVKNFLTQYVK